MAWSKDYGLEARNAAQAAEQAATEAQTAAQAAIDAKDDVTTKWLEAVATVALRDSTYPNPQNGDTVRVTSTSTVYRYQTGTGWVITDEYDSSAIDNVTAQLAEKASKTELLETVGNVSNGTPLFAPSTVMMADTSRNYVNTTDGLLYTFNGTTWVSTGVQYQSTGIAKGAVTRDKLSNTTLIPVNLFNPATAVNNRSVNNVTGALSTNSGFYASDYIPVENGTNITISFGKISSLGAYYDENKNFIAGITGSTNDGIIEPYTLAITNPAAKFIRLSIEKASTPLGTYMVVEGVQFPSEYLLYDQKKYTLDWLEVSNSQLSKDIKLSPTSLEGAQIYVNNRFDITTAKANTLIRQNTGAEFASGAFWATDYIPVEYGDIYTMSDGNIGELGAYYDANKVYVAGIPRATEYGPHTILINQNNIKFMRVNIQLSVTPVDTYMIVKGDEFPLDYRPYGEDHVIYPFLRFNSENIIPTDLVDEPIKRFIGKKLLVSGDSITDENIRATKNWHGYLKDWMYFGEVLNHAVSGTGLSKDSSPTSNNSFFKRFNLLDNYPTPDFILYMGNMNDGSGTNPGRIYNIGTFADQTYDPLNPTLYATMHKFCTDMIAKYPNTPIGFIISTPRKNTEWGVNSYFEEWTEVIKEVCGHYSIPVLDLYHNSGLRPWVAENDLEYFSSPTSPNGDGTHPNAKGQELMARKIYEFVRQYL